MNSIYFHALFVNTKYENVIGNIVCAKKKIPCDEGIL